MWLCVFSYQCAHKGGYSWELCSSVHECPWGQSVHLNSFVNGFAHVCSVLDPLKCFFGGEGLRQIMSKNFTKCKYLQTYKYFQKSGNPQHVPLPEKSSHCHCHGWLLSPWTSARSSMPSPPDPAENSHSDLSNMVLGSQRTPA